MPLLILFRGISTFTMPWARTKFTPDFLYLHRCQCISCQTRTQQCELEKRGAAMQCIEKKSDLRRRRFTIPDSTRRVKRNPAQKHPFVSKNELSVAMRSGLDMCRSVCGESFGKIWLHVVGAEKVGDLGVE
ncbi:hypothetical protein C8J55DRAFT_10356 [Lentinula edodes]|uniref:Uncharacterized protein n=1 Tax=Lentinula lateritia TaxID=40482 RepID=A0A9W9B1K6_9AGAR|nr:hypothetical protein C8J55DRAFT_10356 [Lentinula edodes]